MRFSEIIGLNQTKQTLVNSVKGSHIAHAQLFMGKEGSGNLALALAYATFINCKDKQDQDSCGVCSSCSKMDKLIHPDLHFVLPTTSTKKVTGKNAISKAFLKEWREFVLESPYRTLPEWTSCIGAEDKQASISKEESRNVVRDLSLRAFEAEYKMMFVWLPELMHPAAANAILKILEEPPSKTLFLLVSDDSEKLLTTILSRTQIVKIPLFSDTEITQNLTEKFGVDNAKAAHVAHLAEGNLNEALRLSQEVKDGSSDFFKEWMRVCFKVDFTAMASEADNFNRLGKEAQKSLMRYGLSVFRESLIYKYGAKDLVRLEDAELKFVENFSKVLNETNLEELTLLFSNSHQHIERNANTKILFLNLSIQIARIFRRS
jgi:DNA polymerase-3 subunit delta'